MEDIFDYGSYYESTRAFNAMINIHEIEHTLEVVDVASYLLYGGKYDSKFKIPKSNWLLAEEYVQIIKAYINETMKSVSDVMKQLYIKEK